jgi:4-amino-4-deoxy-L-arabinose transferase-like glycosyltransferase
VKAGAARTTLLLAGLLGLFLLTEWNWFQAPLERDEGEYAYAAWALTQGDVPYRDVFLQKPPLIIYIYWLAQRLSDTAVWPPRALAAVFVLLTATLVWLVARRVYGTRCAWISAWLFVPMIAFPSLLPVAANTEKFMNLPLLAVVALHVGAPDREERWRWVAAGACASLALLIKPICLLLLLFVFLVWLTESARRARCARVPVRMAGLALLGGAAVAAAALGWLFVRGAGGAMWEAAVFFNRAYSAFYGWTPKPFLEQWSGFLCHWWPLILSAFWFVHEKPARWRYFGGLLLLAMLSAYKDPNGHYYQMAVPFWALLAARGLDGASARLGRGQHAAWRPLLAPACIALLCVPLAPHAVRRVNRTFHPYATNPFIESPLIARKLAAVTSPEDRVFIAGSEPQILFHARRRQLSRFAILYPVLLPTPYSRRYQEEVMRAWRSAPPAAVAIAASSWGWYGPHPGAMEEPEILAFLREALQASYRPVGAYIRAAGGEEYWMESAGFQDHVPASVYLYCRSAHQERQR